MRAVLGFTGVHVVLAAVGGALMYALGLVDRRPGRAWLLAIGPAYFCGVALVLPALIALLVVGVALNLVSFLIVSLVAAAALVAAGLRRRAGGSIAPVPAPSRSPFELWAMRAAVALLAIWFLVACFAFPGLPTYGDDLRIWSFRAAGLFFFGHLQQGVLVGDPTQLPHPDYPLLQPALESVTYRAMGKLALQAIHLELWILYGAFVWTVAYLLAPGRRALAWLPVLLALAVAPGGYTWPLIGYADTTVSCFVGAGVLCLGLWLETRRAAYAVLAGVMLMAAANTKNEGLVDAVIVLAAAALASLAGARRRELRWLLLGAAIALIGALPWHLWVSANLHNASDFYPLHDALNWHFLTSRLHRVSEAFKAIADRFQNQAQWVWLAPAFLAICAVALITGTARRLALFYLGATVAITAALVWAYWTSKLPIGFHLATSVDRTVGAVLFVCAVGLAHLGSSLALRSPP
jgi:hypothetical protein